MAALVLSLPYFGDANRWHSASGNEMCLLPFPMSDGLLPGEALQIHLSQPHQLSLYTISKRQHFGCVGQLLKRSSASKPDVKSFCAVAPLLELRETREDCAGGGVWCSYTCVGALRLSDVELRTQREQLALDESVSAENHPSSDSSVEEPFLVAAAEFLREVGGGRDDPPTEDEEAYLALEVTRLHEAVNTLRRTALQLNPDGEINSAADRVTSGGERIGPPPPASDRVRDGRYRLGPLIGPYIGIEELTQRRLDSLCVRGVDEAPPMPNTPGSGRHSDHNRMLELWGAVDDEALRRSMLSYVAVESLHESYRMGAMGIVETAERLEHAKAGLEARQRALAAEVALRRASA